MNVLKHVAICSNNIYFKSFIGYSKFIYLEATRSNINQKMIANKEKLGKVP